MEPATAISRENGPLFRVHPTAITSPVNEEEPTTPPRRNHLLGTLKEHRLYGAALGYLVAAWVILQVAAIVLPGFGAPVWVLRTLMIVLALGLGITLLVVWGRNRRSGGLPTLPRANRSRVLWGLTALLPAVAVAAFFLLRPMPRPVVPTAAPAAPAAMDKSIAVLPFDHFSKDDDSAVFADGVQDEVLTDLAKLADLKVISRSSVLQYKNKDARNLREIGKALGVAYVVEGSVQRSGNNIRVTAQLIDARTDAHQWAEKYDRELRDVFAIQSEIAQAIAGQLQAVISPQEHAAMMEAPTRDEGAYQLYLRAVARWNDYDQATVDYRVVYRDTLELLRQATAKDPGFSRAFAFTTEVQSLFYSNFEMTPATDVAARASAETVARLRPGSADANVAMGYYDYYVRRDYNRAREEFTEVTRQSPNDVRAWFCLGSIARRQGRWEDALAGLRRATELDPENNRNFNVYYEVLAALRRYPEAQDLFDRRIAARPQQIWLHGVKARLLLAWKADTRTARRELALLPPDFDPGGNVTDVRVQCGELERDFATAARELAACPLAEISGLPRGVFEGEIARFEGRASDATAAYTKVRPLVEAAARERPENPNALMQLALVDALLGRKDIALDEGHRALALVTEGDTQEAPKLKYFWAIVLKNAGEQEEAIRILQAINGQPYGPTYGFLRADPEWDGLRGDRRFASLVDSLAPKP